MDDQDVVSIKRKFADVLYFQIWHLVVSYEVQTPGVQFNALKSSHKAQLLLDRLCEVADNSMAGGSAVFEQSGLNFKIFAKSCHFYYCKSQLK